MWVPQDWKNFPQKFQKLDKSRNLYPIVTKLGIHLGSKIVYQINIRAM